MAISKPILKKSLLYMLPWPLLALVLFTLVVVRNPLAIFYFFSSVPTYIAHNIIPEEVGAIVFTGIWLMTLAVPQIEFKREHKVSKATYLLCSSYSFLNVIVAVYLLTL